MNPIKFILNSKIARGWKVVILSLIVAVIFALPLLLITAYDPNLAIPTWLGMVSLFGFICGLISMIGGFFILLFDIYNS